MKKWKPIIKPKRKPTWPKWMPEHLSHEQKDRLQDGERRAVKEAMRRFFVSGVRARSEADVKAYYAAERETRHAAREDFRRQALAELEAQRPIDLPEHISRIPRGSVQGAVEVETAPLRKQLMGKGEA
jgi:hypothetical protein